MGLVFGMSLVGRTFRNIRIVELLGAGGMGEVYLGMDEKLRRQVAVKAIRAERRLDARTKGRFLREAQILGQLQHPNICSIHDFIETEEHDLIVLELLTGSTLSELIGTPMSRRRKLEIARQVASALVAAHSMSVVHRDLKPANTMVTADGAVKVLDFGLARPVASSETDGTTEEHEARDPSQRQSSAPGGEPLRAVFLTEHDQVMGTPLFMSPEQARGEPVTAASDMYSFGLLLQVLFTEQGPYEELEDAAALRTKAMWGDTLPVEGLDPLTSSLIADLKSLRPEERPSAEEACARLREIAEAPRRRRRRLLIAAVWAVLALSTAGMWLQSRRAGQEAQRAEAEAATARQVTRFVVDLFARSDPGNARGADITAREILDTGARRIEQELHDQPLVQATMMHTIGSVYNELGLYKEAEDLLLRAEKERSALLGPTHPELARTLEVLSSVDKSLGRYDEAERQLQRTLAIHQHNHNQLGVAVTHDSLGSLYHAMGRLDEARSRFELAIALFEEHTDMQTEHVATAFHNLARLLLDLGEPEEAESAVRRALAIDTALYGDDHHLVASDLTTLGSILWKQGRLDEAQPLLEQAHHVYETVLGPDHARVADSFNMLAILAYSRGDLAEAERNMREAVAIYRHAHGADHPHVADVLANLGFLVSEQGRADEAIALYKEALVISEKALGPDHPGVATTLHNLAVEYRDLGRFAEAEALFKRAFEIRRKAFGDDGVPVAETLRHYAILLRETGRSAEAEQAQERASRILDQ